METTLQKKLRKRRDLFEELQVDWPAGMIHCITHKSAITYNSCPFSVLPTALFASTLARLLRMLGFDARALESLFPLLFAFLALGLVDLGCLLPINLALFCLLLVAARDLVLPQRLYLLEERHRLLLLGLHDNRTFLQVRLIALSFRSFRLGSIRQRCLHLPWNFQSVEAASGADNGLKQGETSGELGKYEGTQSGSSPYKLN
jgi:hypothetical protein